MVETSMMHGVALSCSYFPKFSKLGNEGQLKEPGEKETALLNPFFSLVNLLFLGRGWIKEVFFSVRI